MVADLDASDDADAVLTSTSCRSTRRACSPPAVAARRRPPRRQLLRYIGRFSSATIQVAISSGSSWSAGSRPTAADSVTAASSSESKSGSSPRVGRAPPRPMRTRARCASDVPVECGGEPDCHRDTVRHVGERSQGVTDRVGDASPSAVDGEAGEQRRFLHRLARSDVVRLGDGDREVVDDQLEGVERRCGDEGGAAPPAHGLEGVDERVEAGGRGHVRRHRHRRRRVEHHEAERKSVAPRPHLASAAVGHDARPRASPRRRCRRWWGWRSSDGRPGSGLASSA